MHAVCQPGPTCPPQSPTGRFSGESERFEAIADQPELVPGGVSEDHVFLVSTRNTADPGAYVWEDLKALGSHFPQATLEQMAHDGSCSMDF